MKQDVIGVQKDVEKLLQKNMDFCKEMNDLKSEVVALKTHTVQEDGDGKSVSFAEMVTKQVEKHMETVHDEVKVVQKTLTETREKALEEKDKENRLNNIILYRADESTADTPENRNKEDYNFCLQLFEGLNSGVVEEDVIKVFRLGRRQENAPPRPLLIQLNNRMAKSLVMNSAYKLSGAPARFRNVIVAHDLTKKERLECKELVEEAKQKTEQDSSGNWVYKVRGPPGQMRIVKFRRNQD